MVAVPAARRLSRPGFRERTSVRFRPPAWDERGRPRVIDVSANARLVIVEAVGAGRRETAHLVDGIVWVQGDVNDDATPLGSPPAKQNVTARRSGWPKSSRLWPNSGRGSGPSRSSREPPTYATIPRPRSCLA